MGRTQHIHAHTHTHLHRLTHPQDLNTARNELSLIAGFVSGDMLMHVVGTKDSKAETVQFNKNVRDRRTQHNTAQHIAPPTARYVASPHKALHTPCLAHTHTHRLTPRQNCIIKSKATSIRWVPGSRARFVAAFASGHMLLMDAARTDPPHDMDLKPLAVCVDHALSLLHAPPRAQSHCCRVTHVHTYAPSPSPRDCVCLCVVFLG